MYTFYWILFSCRRGIEGYNYGMSYVILPSKHCGYYGVALTTVSTAKSTSYFERRPQIPCRVFADPPGRRGGGGIGSSTVHIHYNHHAIRL